MDKKTKQYLLSPLKKYFIAPVILLRPSRYINGSPHNPSRCDNEHCGQWVEDSHSSSGIPVHSEVYCGSKDDSQAGPGACRKYV